MMAENFHCGKIAVTGRSTRELSINSTILDFFGPVPEGQRFKSSPRYQFQSQIFEIIKQCTTRSSVCRYALNADLRGFKQVNATPIAVKLRYANKIVFLIIVSEESLNTLTQIQNRTSPIQGDIAGSLGVSPGVSPFPGHTSNRGSARHESIVSSELIESSFKSNNKPGVKNAGDCRVLSLI